MRLVCTKRHLDRKSTTTRRATRNRTTIHACLSSGLWCPIYVHACRQSALRAERRRWKRPSPMYQSTAVQPTTAHSTLYQVHTYRVPGTSSSFRAKHWAKKSDPALSPMPIQVLQRYSIPFQDACPDVEGVRSIVKVDRHGLHQSSNGLRSDHSRRGKGCCACCPLLSCCDLTVMRYPSHTWPDVECKRKGGCCECKASVGEAHSTEGRSGTRCPRSSHPTAVWVYGDGDGCRCRVFCGAALLSPALRLENTRRGFK